MILIDAITRLIPGALGDPDGALDDSSRVRSRWSIHTIPVLLNFAAGVFLMSCFLAIMPKLPVGGVSRLCCEPGSVVLIF